MKKPLIIFDFYRTLYSPESGQLYDGINGVLENLYSRNFTMVLITSGKSKRKELIEKLKISNFFEKILIVSEKNKLIFGEIISEIPPTRIVIVGDRLDEELRIGNDLGIETLVINPDLEEPAIAIKRRFL